MQLFLHLSVFLGLVHLPEHQLLEVDDHIVDVAVVMDQLLVVTSALV